MRGLLEHHLSNRKSDMLGALLPQTPLPRRFAGIKAPQTRERRGASHDLNQDEWRAFGTGSGVGSGSSVGRLNVKSCQSDPALVRNIQTKAAHIMGLAHFSSDGNHSKIVARQLHGPW